MGIFDRNVSYPTLIFAGRRLNERHVLSADPDPKEKQSTQWNIEKALAQRRFGPPWGSSVRDRGLRRVLKAALLSHQ